MSAMGESGRKRRGVPAILVAALAILVWGNVTAQVSTNARTGRFIRGYGTVEDVQSIVLALDFQKGVALDPIGGNGSNWLGGQPLGDVFYHYNATNQASASGTNGRIAYQTPIAAFGGRMGGTPLYVETQYRFGTAPGVNAFGTGTPMFYMYVYDKRSNYLFMDLVPFEMPLTDQTDEWTAFGTNGYTLTKTSWGIRTTIADHAGTRWGLDDDSVTDSYVLTHEAVESSATNYLFEFRALGYFYLWDNEEYYAMSVSATNGAKWTQLYSLEFETRPAGRVLFIDQPHFRGEPLPSEYAGKSVEELTNFTATVTNHIWIATNDNYLAVDQSPELRQHPILDKFVADMRYDPLALTEFVLNEIDLTDPLVFGNSNYVSADSVNLGGINRGALGTFLERQGSPWEQCALLVYLLRASGQWAAYVFPTNNNLKMLDTRLSKLLRMQLKGAVRENGKVFTSNSLITVNYPWVVANINSNRVVHIFPWLKDTEVVEGLNLYDYMPTNYDSGYRWAKQFMFGDTNIFNLSSESDVPNVLFPKFIERALLTNTNHAGISIDDLGVKAFNRRHSYARWEDLPRPTVLSNQTQVTVISNLVSVSNSLPWITSIFDTVRVRVWRGTTNLFDTGAMRAADLNARKFLLFTNDTKLNLWLAPYRPSITNQSLFTNDSALLNKQLLQTNVLTGDTNLLVGVTHLRHQWLTNELKGSNSFELSESRTVSNAFRFSKADVAGICLDMGRVTIHMLEPHMEDYWREERKKQLNPAHLPEKEDFQGTAAYLIGMGYHEKKSRFKELNEGLHKVRELSVCGAGLGKLTAKLVSGTNKTQPGVDMVNSLLVLAANGTLRPDSGMDETAGFESYRWMRGVSSSAEEHAIINGAFRETNAISTVRLLQLAQRQSHSNRVGIVELHNYNYATRGGQASSGYPSTLLKNYDTTIWADVTNAFFNGDHPEYSTVFITPASITNGSKSYIGMGAFIFEDSSDSSLISANQNGGAGSDHGWFAGSSGDSFLPYYLITTDDGFEFNATDPTYTRVEAPLSPTEMARVTAGIYQLIGSLAQRDLAADIGLSLNLPNNDFGSALFAGGDTGFMGLADFLETMHGLLSDPVNALTGEFYIDATDLTLPGPMPLQVRRSYLSQNRAPNQFGVGWKMNYMPYLVMTTNSSSVALIYAAEMEGSVIVYRKTNDVWRPHPADNPTLNNHTTAGMGSTVNLFNARIERLVTNTIETYFLHGPDGSVRRFETSSQFEIISGTNNLDRTRPYLREWQDNRGNFYRFGYGTNSMAPDFGQMARIESSNGSFLGFRYDVYARIIEAYTGDGRRLFYEYDRFGDLVRVTLPDASEIEYEYQHYTYTSTNGPTIHTNLDSNHLLVREVKPDGHVLENFYDSKRRVTVQKATVGPDLNTYTNAVFTYVNNFNLTNAHTNLVTGYTLIADAYNRTNRYDYTNGLITSITNALGHATLQDWFEPGEANNPGYYRRSLEKVTDTRGLQTFYKYDTNGNPTSIVVQGDLTGNGNTSEQAVSTAAFNTNNLMTESMSPSGATNRYLYTNTWLLSRLEIHPTNATSSSIISNVFVYYNATNTVTNGTRVFTNVALGLRQREIRAFGTGDAATNDWVHDGRGFPTAQIRYTGTSDPHVTNTLVYNARGELIEQTDTVGRKTRLAYDGLGRPIYREVFEASQAVPLSWEYSYYNANGKLVWNDGPRYDPEDYVWNDYDGADRHTQQIIWRTRAKVDGSGVEAVPGYDGFATSFKEYDLFGNLIRIIDARGAIATNTYDGIGRLIAARILDTDGSVLKSEGFAYEPGGQVTFQTNALTAVSETRYTSMGNPYYRTNFNGSTSGWRYYRDGRPEKEFLPNGNYVETTYQDSERKVTKIFRTAAGTALSTNVSEMDRRGNVVRTMDAAHVWFTNSFDGLDRLKATAGPVVVFTNPPGMDWPPPPPPVQQTTINFYDAAGVVLMTVNGLGETNVARTDAMGRTVSTAIYASDGMLVRTNGMVYAANHHSVTTYAGSGASAIRSAVFTDNQNRLLLSLRYPNSGLTEFVLHGYDAVGNRTELRECSSSNGAVTTWATNFWSHDNLNRVRIETVRDGVTTTFKYDASGNLTNRLMPGNFEWRASYDLAGRITKDYDISGSAGANTNTYAYYGASSPFAGLLQTKTNGSGVVCTYGYDQFLRLATNAHDGPLAEQDLTTVRSFDSRGLLIELKEWFATSATGPSNYTSRAYTPYQQVVAETMRIDGAQHSSWRQTWDKAGRRKGLNYAGYGFSFAWRADRTLASVNVPRLNGGATYTYDTAGQMLTRSAGNSRVTTYTARDGTGRPLAANTVLATVTELTETLSWRGDGRLLTHTVDRNEDFTNDQQFDYANLTRRLTQERLKLDSTRSWTNSFVYDGGQPSRLGLLTRAGNTNQGLALWSGTADALHRIANETNNVLKHIAAGDVNGLATISAFLDGRPVPVAASVTTNGGSWQASLELTPGTHQLQARALHPLMVYTASTNHWFTNSVAAQTVTVVYDASGQIAQRIWKIGSATNRVQVLTWDGKGRLLKVAERDTNNTGVNWTATYDGLGRRLRTTSVTVTNGVTNSGFSTVISQLFDPEIAFLEMGVVVNGETTWKLYGPDLNGSYGGLNGTGGLEAIAPPPDLYCPIIADSRGNLHGVYDQRHLARMWFPSRVTGYGAVPGYRPNVLGHGAMVDSSSAWRGRWIDITGLIWLGARYYDPEGGRFLSTEPLGHGTDASLYTYAGGDPINYVDPDGMAEQLSGVSFSGGTITPHYSQPGTNPRLVYNDPLEILFPRPLGGSSIASYPFDYNWGSDAVMRQLDTIYDRNMQILRTMPPPFIPDSGRITSMDIQYGEAAMIWSGVRAATEFTFSRVGAWHTEMQAAYTWGAPPGLSFREGVSHQMRQELGLVHTEAELHHWGIPQNQWGASVPNYIKNRQWNITVMENRAAHAMVDTAFTVRGIEPYPLLIRPFIAMPNWARAAAGATSVGLAYLGSELLDNARAPESFESSVGLRYDLPSAVTLGRK